VYSQLTALPNESIYDGPRLAQPDEVANYNTGDGVEKAFTLANIIRNRKPQQAITLQIEKDKAVVKADKEYVFNSTKGLEQLITV
jgi:hypothetical protein